MAETPGIYLGANLGGSFYSRNTDNDLIDELSLGYQFNHKTAVQLTGFAGRRDNGWLMLEGLSKLPLNRYITPYFLFGAGYAHLNGGSIGFDLGAGINFNITENWTVLAQYKFVQALGNETPHSNVISGGVTYYFGR